MPNEPRDSAWVIYPQPPSRLTGVVPGFSGMATNVDEGFAANSISQELSFVDAQNTFDNNGDMFSIRPYGTEIFPSTQAVSVAAGGYSSLFTFHLRSGENILMAARGSVLQWFDETSQAYVTLQSSRQSANYGFAEYNINANAESRVYFGNGLDNFAYWNGGHTNLNGALVGGEATITVTSTASFLASGSILIGGTTVTYTGVTATTFTGCTGTPAAANGLAVSQAVIEDGSAPKGNIYMSAQNRLFIAGTSNPQLVLFSKYGDPATWSTTTVLSSTATSAGAFNLIEGGGSVTAMCQDEQSLYFFKQGIVYSATLTDSLYSLVPLKPYDGRSPSTGALGRRSVFVGGNQVFVVTADNRILALQRIATIDYPQLKPISYIIQPTCDAYDFSSVSGIAFKNYAWFACKSSSTQAVNDVVLPYNIVTDQWEAPIKGWAVAEWAVYDKGTGPNLYYADANSPNVWKLVTSAISDGPYMVTAYRTTKRYNFDGAAELNQYGGAAELKELDAVFVEGYISPSTSLTVELFLDEDGFAGTYKTTFSGTENTFLVGNLITNTFGSLPFGTETFGSDPDLSGLRRFRVYFNKDLKRIPFYNCQLKFSSSGLNQRWAVTRYGFKVRLHSQPMRSSLFRKFS